MQEAYRPLHRRCIYPCISILPEMRDIVKIEQMTFTRSITDKKIQLIKDKLSKENWSEMLSPLKCNAAFTKFHDCLTKTIESLCPEKRIKVKGNTKHKEPWNTKGILRSIVKQKRLYKESIKNAATGKTEEYKAYKSK